MGGGGGHYSNGYFPLTADEREGNWDRVLKLLCMVVVGVGLLCRATVYSGTLVSRHCIISGLVTERRNHALKVPPPPYVTPLTDSGSAISLFLAHFEL